MNEDRVNQLRALMAAQGGAARARSTVVPFPRAMKSGPKVRRGPCAQLLRFPTQSSGDELDAQFDWMRDNEHKWETEETEGFAHRGVESRRMEDWIRIGRGLEPVTDAAKRKQIAKGRNRIEKRNRVKEWLADRGADLREITTPEQALFYMFEFIEAGDVPSIA